MRTEARAWRRSECGPAPKRAEGCWALAAGGDGLNGSEVTVRLRVGLRVRAPSRWRCGAGEKWAPWAKAPDNGLAESGLVVGREPGAGGRAGWAGRGERRGIRVTGRRARARGERPNEMGENLPE